MIMHLSSQATDRSLDYRHILLKLSYIPPNIIKLTSHIRHLSYQLMHRLKLAAHLFKHVSNILYVVHTTSLALFQRNGKRRPSRTLLPSSPQTTSVPKTIDFSTARASSFLYASLHALRAITANQSAGSLR